HPGFLPGGPMTFFDLVSQSFAASVTFLTKTQTRIQNAQTAAKAGNYKADNLAGDVVGFWGDAMAAVEGLLPGDDASLPTCFFQFKVADTANKTRMVHVSPPVFPAGQQVQPAPTSLVKVGGGNKKIQPTLTLNGDT